MWKYLQRFILRIALVLRSLAWVCAKIWIELFYNQVTCLGVCCSELQLGPHGVHVGLAQHDQSSSTGFNGLYDLVWNHLADLIEKSWNMLMPSRITPTFQSLVWMQQRYCIPSPPSEGFSKPAASTWVWWTLNILSFEASRINIKIDVQADRKDLFVLKERGHDQNCVNTRRTWRYWDF